MTVRFKSEYQKSYGVSRSRSVSPQRRYLLVGLPSAQMASRSSSAHKNRRSTKPRPEEVSESPSRPEPGSTSRRETDGKPAKLRPPEPGGTATAERRPGGQRSEYHRQFGWKEPVSAASPLLTAEQVLYSSSRSVPPFKKNPVPMETEYRRRRRQTEPLFHTYSIHRRKSLEPHTKPQVGHKTTKDDNRSLSPPRDGPRPAQVPRRRRMLTEYQSSFHSRLCRNPEEGGGADGLNEQVKELRRQALAYRRRAWGTNFSRNHLSQLLSEHNVLWELSDTTDSHSEPPTPPPSAGASPEPHGRATSSVEALDLASICSRTSSAGGKTPGDAGRETSPGPERQTAWGEEEETDEEEGRLPTPRMKTRPAQRTHHDLTTPATRGAILVGKLTNMEDSSPSKQKQKMWPADSPEPGSDTAVNKPIKLKEAWSENGPVSVSGSPTDKQTSSPQPKPTRMKGRGSSPVAPPLLASFPQHGIQGMLRHPDFQHNGQLGLRLKELPCSRTGCGSDEDGRLSVMSWRSAASCSAASAILERAQKRREDFWGKR